MTQYTGLNIKLSNSQLNKLKSAIKNETEVVLRLSWNMIGNSDDKTNFPHELLLTNNQKLLQIIYQEKTGLSLIKNVIKLLAKNVLIPLGLTAAASAADAGIHEKNIRIREYNINYIK